MLDVDYDLEGCVGVCAIPGFGGRAVLVGAAVFALGLSVALCGLPALAVVGVGVTLAALDALVQLRVLGTSARDHWLLQAFFREHEASFEVRAGVLTVVSGQWTRRLVLAGAVVEVAGRCVTVRDPSGAQIELRGRPGDELDVAALAESITREVRRDPGSIHDVPASLGALRQPD